MRTVWKLMLSLTLMLAVLVTAAMAAELTPGATVAADPESPTGYTVTFVYEDAAATQVELFGTFAFYEEGDKAGFLPETYLHAADWKPGMFRGSNTDLAAKEPMKKVEGTNLWTVSLALPSGHYLYNYRVNDETNITDPANPPMTSTAQSGNRAKLSTVDVPYAPEQGASVNFDFMLPRQDGKAGQVVYADYTDVYGNLAPLAIYLPYGYDAQREAGYKTLYLCHGAGGNEMEWFSSGSSHHVFDTLIADGKVEPTIIVTLRNVYSGSNHELNSNVLDCIVPFMEAHYNVGKEPADRAFAGLSAGGSATSRIYYENADKFGYFGIFSGAQTTVYKLEGLNQEKLNSPKLMLGGGIYDFGIAANFRLSGFAVTHLATQLANAGINYDFYIVKGGHDWTVWPQLLEIFATDYLWQ